MIGKASNCYVKLEKDINLFFDFHGNIFVPGTQKIGFHEKTENIIEHLTKSLISIPTSHINYLFFFFLLFSKLYRINYWQVHLGIQLTPIAK